MDIGREIGVHEIKPREIPFEGEEVQEDQIDNDPIEVGEEEEVEQEQEQEVEEPVKAA